jgi:hypothetical protein
VCGLDISGSEYGLLAGSCEHGNEHSLSIECWGFLEWLCNWRLLNKLRYYFGVEILMFVSTDNTVSLRDVTYYDSDFFLFVVSLNA